MLLAGLRRAPMSPAGCSRQRLPRHHFDLRPFISPLWGAANLSFSVVIWTGTSVRCVKMDSSNAAARFATTAMRLRRLWCPFGEVQQDLLLSCLTIGQAYC